MDILVVGTTPSGFPDWSPERKVDRYEEVQWWHDYTAMLIHEGKATHVWGRRDFCSAVETQSVSAGAVVLFEARDYDEFDALHKLDPIRDATRLQSIVLKPIADQRESDERRLKAARARLGGRRG